MRKEEEDLGGFFLGVLTLIFITLKLVGVIAWSWWWVLAPIWAPVAIAIIIAIGMYIFARDQFESFNK